MEKFRVTFEMTNGEKHFYEIESDTESNVYNLINNCNDGWINVTENSESHYIKADKLTRVIVISELDFCKRQKEKSEKTAKALESLNF
jgi:hypothetical protein